MQAGGRAASWHDGTIGKAIKASYAQDADPGTFVMSEGGSGIDFTVLSIDISANDGDTGGGGFGTPEVRGLLGGVEQWSILPTMYVGLQTYTAATSGDISLAVDTIEWIGPVSDGTIWNNEIDNLVVDTIPEPATLGLLALSGAAIYIKRKMM
jgi:hypothetical protein